MKKLLITLLLISPFSFADWGDVYYCEMTAHSRITLEGDKENYKLGKFTFKLDKAKKAMVFGSQGYFSDTEMKLKAAWPSRPSKEEWKAEDVNSRAYFKEGKFLYSWSASFGINSMHANCDKF
ncbi:hypothetical protein OAM86_02950 [Porticoccaceae bacterium]|nr:hypothetical protein [Porticoccaceae bacterium]